MQVKRQLEAECNGNMSGNLEIEIPEKIPQGSKKSQPGMGAFTTPNRKLAENASESTPRNKRKEQESFPIETPGKIPKTDLINRSLLSTPTGRNTVHPPPHPQHVTVSDCKRQGADQPSTCAGWSVPLLFTTMSVLKHFVDVHYYIVSIFVRFTSVCCICVCIVPYVSGG